MRSNSQDSFRDESCSLVGLTPKIIAPSKALQESQIVLQSTCRQFLLTWAVMIISALWLAFTIFFAYNSTLTDPIVPNLVFATPSRTLNTLNVLSHVSIILLQILTADVFEAIRWALASSARGISALDFCILSRATSLMGVLYLLGSRGFSRSAQFCFTPRSLWGGQRSEC